MALAILELLAVEKSNVRFTIDTGTNRYYRLKIGSSFQRKHGVDWVDDVYVSTHLDSNEAGGGLLNSSKEISIPAARFRRGNAYAQLFSFKTAEGKSPAFSSLVTVPVGAGGPVGIPVNYTPPFSISTSMTTPDCSFQSPRTVPCRTGREEYARPASLEDVLAGIVKVAAPVVLNLLGGASGGAGQAAASGALAAGGNPSQAGILVAFLNSILGALPGGASSAVSRPQSRFDSLDSGNRFLGHHDPQLSQQFIFGIDDALLASLAGTLVGPIVQALPQLMNAANQQRIQQKQADNKLISDVLSDVNRRMLLQQLLQTQRAAPSGGQPVNGVDLNQLLQLLQQPSAAPQPAPQASPPATPVTQSLSLEPDSSSATLSSRAVVSFVTANPVPWNGLQKVLFAKNQGLQLRLRLNVAAPVPKTPLPKAILKIVFKSGSDQSLQFEKTFKQKNVSPNSVLSLAFSQTDLAGLPVNKAIAVLAEMRWLSPKTGREYKALGSSEIILVNKYFLKDQGKDVAAEQELTDMKRFKPFWNKVWEAPSLDATPGEGDTSKKYLWELNTNAKYSVLLSAEHEANGLMETKILKAKSDAEGLTEKTEGRMKAGIELSVVELNKLVSLWDRQSPLDADKLEAFNSLEFLKSNAGEFIYNFKLKGRAGERGMVWVVPIFKLFEFPLSAVQKTDDTGQVSAVTEEKVRLPLPVSARVIGLKSK